MPRMLSVQKAGLLSLSLLALAPAVLATPGQVTINNHCAYPVYAWTVADAAGPPATVPAHGGQLVQAYVRRAAGGVSIKIARQPSLAAPHTQLEYTAEPGALWYDLSNIDGNPFADARVLLHPLAPWEASCKPVDCPPGQACSAAYTHPSDDWATHACPADTGLVFDLCVNA